MATVTIYTTRMCPYCVRAKRLLSELGASVNEISVESDDKAFEEMQLRSRRRTVPQIWIDEVHVGGCDDLVALHRSGQLVPMLNG